MNGYLNSKRFATVIFFVLAFITIHSAGTLAATPKSGWWYNPDENGTGISIEIQGDTLFMAWYVFDGTNGNAVWYTSDGTVDGSGNFSGALYRWEGWPLGEAYYSPVRTAVGTVQIVFYSDDAASLAWTLGTESGSKEIVKFLNEFSPGSLDPRDIHGWWFDPAYNGMGFFMECRGDIIFIAWYHYRSDSSPRWWSVGGGFSSSMDIFSGKLQEFSNGQCIGCDYVHPSPKEMEDITLSFLPDGTATLAWTNEVYNLQRFIFGQTESGWAPGQWSGENIFFTLSTDSTTGRTYLSDFQVSFNGVVNEDICPNPYEHTANSEETIVIDSDSFSFTISDADYLVGVNGSRTSSHSAQIQVTWAAYDIICNMVYMGNKLYSVKGQ